jgi:hypothetical protein
MPAPDTDRIVEVLCGEILRCAVELQSAGELLLRSNPEAARLLRHGAIRARAMVKVATERENAVTSPHR